MVISILLRNILIHDPVFVWEQMCCEQEECYVAVFDHTEAVCYFKGAGALHTYDFVAEEGFSSFELLFREGETQGLALTVPARISSKL